MFFSLTDTMLLLFGNILFLEDADFYCLNNNIVIPTNNGGASFLLGYSLHLLMFSLMLWVVFYKIPSKYGLISKAHE